MDPYIEGQRWRDFHTSLLFCLRRALTPLIAPHYIAEIEEDILIETDPDEPPQVRVPDVGVVFAGSKGSSAVAVVPPHPSPVTVRLPDPRQQRRIVVRLRPTGQVVTVIEVLSPDNKRPFSRGYLRYLDKREALLESPVHLVELDLLRGGERMPLQDPLPPADYYVLVSRAEERPRCQLQPFTVRDPLPIFLVPLLREHGEVSLDLGAIFSELYDESGYAFALDYTREPVPPLHPADRDWARKLQSRGTASG
jgi:hypothetical protein